MRNAPYSTASGGEEMGIQLNRNVLSCYPGGQLQVQNESKRQFFQGGIQEILMAEKEGIIRVNFAWLALGEYPRPRQWQEVNPTYYQFELAKSQAYGMGCRRIAVDLQESPHLLVFVPPDVPWILHRELQAEVISLAKSKTSPPKPQPVAQPCR